MIKVLQVFHGMGCGGAENMIMNLFRKIDKSKVQFDFLVHTDEKCFFDDEIRLLGGQIYCVPYFNGKNFLQYKKALKKFFESHREYTVVHGHLGSSATIYLSVARKYGCTTIAHSHSANTENILYNIFSYPTRYVADKLIGCSEKAGIARYGKWCWKKKNGFILANGIDVEKFLPNDAVRNHMRKQLCVEDKFVIGHIGSFGPPKNHMYLLEIFKCIADKHQDSVLLLVGDGKLRERIENKAQELEIKEKVIMTGIRSDVNKLIQAMDCFVFPSLYEGLPVTVVEAQAASLPCFISDKITDEVCITDLVKRLSIDNAPNLWADEIVNSTDLCRKNMSKEISSAGYDINITAKWLQNFYIENAGK